MIIDYAPDRVFTQSLDIVDAGNACVRCIDKEGVEYYIITISYIVCFYNFIINTDTTLLN